MGTQTQEVVAHLATAEEKARLGITVRESAKYLAATRRDEVLQVHRAARRLRRS